ncbi:hypothetical protein [Paracoccus sp. (in: a-proteobacteria)]|uniref:hypothetical protein n=1 Tax=Paracoccus sp. TaxID=267 RepID=UPI0026DEE7B2|nr:hypothetical protein [Paracoccus sp. (in: a-proteobacteria)]MDO5647517.1 hypothetical protein [Paracoccus sp. (in: a-proteobacteria)]
MVRTGGVSGWVSEAAGWSVFRRAFGRAMTTGVDAMRPRLPTVRTDGVSEQGDKAAGQNASRDMRVARNSWMWARLGKVVG